VAWLRTGFSTDARISILIRTKSPERMPLFPDVSSGFFVSFLVRKTESAQ